MAEIGETSVAFCKPAENKPVIVRVKRKSHQSPLEAFWLEINERPLKRPLLDFEKLSITDAVSGEAVEELKSKKVFVQHVETRGESDTGVDFLQSFVRKSADEHDHKLKNERKRNFKKDNKHEQLLSKARENQAEVAKNARFEQIWRKRQGSKEAIHDKALDDMCHFYDVVRVDVEERSSVVKKQEVTSLEDQRLLQSYLPLLREFIPSAAEEIESDMLEKDEYVYDYYTVADDMDMDDKAAFYPFPLVQVEDEDFYDGPDDESDYDTEDSNAEHHPRHEYPDESSEEEIESESEEQESDSATTRSSEFEDVRQDLSGDAERAPEDEVCHAFSNGFDDEVFDYFENGDDFDSGGEDGDDEQDWR